MRSCFAAEPQRSLASSKERLGEALDASGRSRV
jgi:hypothetical protein